MYGKIRGGKKRGKIKKEKVRECKFLGRKIALGDLVKGAPLHHARSIRKLLTVNSHGAPFP